MDTDGQPEGDLQQGKSPQMNWVPAADMIHFVGLGFDGLVGLSPIKYFMKNTIGLAQAAEKFGSRFYANNGRPGGLLTYKGQKLDPAAKEQIKNSWQEAQAGRNQGRPAVLTGDWDWKDMHVPADEMQFIQTRKYQDEQICGMFKVPPHKAGILERSTNNNIEHQSLEFVRDCLGSVINKWECELSNKLLPAPAIGRNAARNFFAKFDSSGLIQGDFLTTMQALNVGVLNGTFSINDALRRLNCNPIGPEGDMHMTQAQYTSLEALDAQADVAKAQAKQTIEDIKNGVKPAVPSAPTPEQPDSNPADNIDSPDDSGARYSPLFQDAFNRVCKREKRDYEAVSQAFQPLLRTITSDIAAKGMTLFRDASFPEESFADILKDQITAMTKRAADWKDASEEEMQKTIKALRIAIYKDIAIRKAKGA